MKFYLSSSRLWNEVEKLKSMLPHNPRILFLVNAADYKTDRRERSIERAKDLGEISNNIEILDLKDYFGRKDELYIKIFQADMVRVIWWNTFVLRQAMKLSGLDEIIIQLWKEYHPIIYGGYSAGVSVLWPTLKRFDIVDDPTIKPYGEYETIWEGLWILPYCIATHYKSDHPESADIDKVVERMIDNKVLFVALRDWEVIIIK